MATLGRRERTHCPQCFRPVSFSPGPMRGFPKGRARCDWCGRNYQPDSLTEAVRCALCGTWLDARGIRDGVITCTVCGKVLDVRGENTRMREDLINLPLRCPDCLLPIRYRPRGAGKIPYCEHCDRTVDTARLVRTVQCAACFGWINCAAVRGGRVTCPHCRRPMIVSGERVEPAAAPAEISDADTRLVYLSSVRAPVRALPGFVPMALNGGQPRPAEDPSLETDDVLFVRERFPAGLKLGTPNAVDLADGKGGRIRVRAAAEAEIDVADPRRFLIWTGCRPIGMQNLPGMGAIQDCFARAVYRAADETVKQGEALTALALADGIRGAFSEGLLPETGLSCHAIRMQNLSAEAAVDTLAYRVERPIRWVTAGIRVYEKQHPELWADVTLTGTAHIRIADRDVLEHSTSGVRWAQTAAAENAAERYLSERIGEQVYAYFQEQLQGVIENTGVHVDYLSHFLTYMQRVAERFLNEENDMLSSLGLRAANVTVSLLPENIQYSPALQRHEDVEREITLSEMDDRLRDYAAKMARKQAESAQPKAETAAAAMPEESPKPEASEETEGPEASEEPAEPAEDDEPEEVPGDEPDDEAEILLGIES